MQKDFQNEGVAIHYSGRDYDRVCQKLAAEEIRRKELKQKLLVRLSSMPHNNPELMNQIFLTVDEVLN